jgi:hypothetical protein
MSLFWKNLFWKNLFGMITPTAKFEKKEADLIQAMHHYEKVEKSAELSEYKKLYHVVKSARFQENKKTLQNRKYEDTEEYHIIKRYKKLYFTPSIRLYYKVLDSEELKSYLSFKSTSEYELLGNKKEVRTSEFLQKMKKFEKSKAFKNYSRFHDSYIIKEYERLQQKIATPEFKKLNDFWAKSNRWHSTPKFVQQERFYKLAKNPDIVFYENAKPERFEKYRNLKLSFKDEFEWNKLEESPWKYGFHYKSPQLIGDHSFVNEKQANNSGKNISVVDGILRIATNLEKVVARAWHPTKGFVDHEFQYTSDVIQTADSFRQKQGVFRAKLRCSGEVQHAFWLGSDNKLPTIKIFHYDGKRITLGNANNNAFDGIKIAGLNPRKFFIYSLLWTEKELVWSINNLEVYRTASNIPFEKMYLAFNSFISEKQHGSTGSLEVDWVKVYTN